MSNSRKRTLAILLLAVALPVMACGSLTVVNDTPNAAVVKVQMPDEGYGSVYLYAGQSASWYVVSGGPYTVEVLPDNVAYLNSLKSYRDILTDAIFLAEEGSEPRLGDVLAAGSALALLDDQITALSGAGVTCTGDFPDVIFDLYANALTPEEHVVTLKHDPATSTWSCQ